MILPGPIIISGMHRSGTSLLSGLLGELGLFVGNDTTQVEKESFFFLQINRWLFEQCGAAWDRPSAVDELFSQEQFYGFCKDYISKVLRSPFSSGFVGSKVDGGICSMSKPWGWKDPRNTYTLPLWLDLFPNAKVVTVARNGIDVASSLKVRAEAYLAKKRRMVDTGRLLRRKKLFGAKFDHRKMLRLSMSLRCLSLEGSFSLWEEYMEKSREHVDSLDVRAVEVCYESLLTNPRETLRQICGFCDISVDEQCLETAIAGIRPDRANAYVSSPELVSFAVGNRERLARFGY